MFTFRLGRFIYWLILFILYGHPLTSNSGQLTTLKTTKEMPENEKDHSRFLPYYKGWKQKGKRKKRHSSYIPQFVSLHICTTVNAFKIISHTLLMAIACFQSIIYNIRQRNRFWWLSYKCYKTFHSFLQANSCFAYAPSNSNM